MIEQVNIYKLTGEEPWKDQDDTGNVHPHTDGTLDRFPSQVTQNAPRI